MTGKNFSKKRKINTSRKQNTTTSYYVTTSYYRLQSWGGFFPKKVIYFEQINTNLYLCNFRGKYSLLDVKVCEQKDDGRRTKICYYLEIDGEKYEFKSAIQRAPYHTPSIEKVKLFVSGLLKPRPFPQIIADICHIISILFDFRNETDLTVLKLFIGQSYLIPILNDTFFVGIDSTKGGGKTTLLEILTTLMRHGYLGGEVSTAALARMIDSFGLNIGIDEIDQSIGVTSEESKSAILRKAQRRNNPYIRCVGQQNIPTPFDVFGCHCFTYRSMIEDALSTRTFSIHTAESLDNRLPVLNRFKRELLEPLAEELFFWTIENILVLYQKSVVTCSNVAGCRRVFEAPARNATTRTELYAEATKCLNSDELTLLSKMTGRNVELSFLALEIADLLGLDIFSELSKIMSDKISSEQVSDNYYSEVLQEVLSQKHTEMVRDRTLRFIKRDGRHAPCCILPKKLAYETFIEVLVEKHIPTIGHKKFVSLLLDLGFVKNDTIASYRFGGSYPQDCLHFTAEIFNRIKPHSSDPLIPDLPGVESRKG